MSITYTNYYKTIYDRLKVLLIAEIPAFVNKNRILFKPIDSKYLGVEDVIFIHPMLDNLEYDDTAGRTSTYFVELYYLIKIQPDIDYDRITAMGERLKKLFGPGNYRVDTYWHKCNVSSIDYQPDLPEEIKDTYGFKMTLEIHKSQY